MKQLILILYFALAFATVSAQPKFPTQQKQQFSPEQFQKHMESYIKWAAQLTDDEAQKFFPMLSEMQKKQRENSHQIRQQMQKGNNAKTEAEFENILKETTRLESLNKKLDSDYNKKFKTVLSWKKIYKVRQALEQYNMMALQRFTPQGGMRNGMPGFGGANQNGPFGKRDQQNKHPNPMWNGQQNQDNSSK